MYLLCKYEGYSIISGYFAGRHAMSQLLQDLNGLLDHAQYETFLDFFSQLEPLKMPLFVCLYLTVLKRSQMMHKL